MVIAEWLIFLAKGYAIVGAIIAAAFVFFGVDRVDASARRSYSFRPLIVPGVVLLWPLVLVRWMTLEKEGR